MADMSAAVGPPPEPPIIGGPASGWFGGTTGPMGPKAAVCCNIPGGGGGIIGMPPGGIICPGITGGPPDIMDSGMGMPDCGPFMAAADIGTLSPYGPHTPGTL